MSRLAAQAVAQYYPTPAALLPVFASLVAVDPRPPTEDAWMDPCAGEGEALAFLLSHLYRTRKTRAYGAELELVRHRKAETAVRVVQGVSRAFLLRADALHVRAALTRRGYRDGWEGMTGLWLNPPYDTDRRFGRLEERFLRRFGPLVAPEGVLLYLIPVTALRASAETLGREWETVEVYRLPDGHYEAFRQVIVRARRRRVALLTPAPEIVARVTAAAEDPLSLPVLGVADHAPWTLPVLERPGCEWEAGYLDETALYEAHGPWNVSVGKGRTERARAPFPPPGTLGAVQHRYRAAVPAKPAHLAAALAAGVLDGDRLRPDPGQNLPVIAAKGSFARVWRTEEEKVSKTGEVVGRVQIERPSLTVTVLDVEGAKYATLEAKPEPSGEDALDKLTTGDLLVRYSGALASAMTEHCPADFDPQDPAQAFPLVETGRPLFEAQRGAVRALLVQLGGPAVPLRQRYGRVAYLMGEVGCGKTVTFLVTARNAGARRVLVLVPPHLLDSWRNEVGVVWPEARVRVLDTLSDVDALAADPDPSPVVALLTREKAKLGHAWVAVRGRCPACGGRVPVDVDHASKRSRCAVKHTRALSRAAKLSDRLEPALRGHGEGTAPGTPRPVMSWSRASRTILDAVLALLPPVAAPPRAEAAFEPDLDAVDPEDLDGEEGATDEGDEEETAAPEDLDESDELRAKVKAAEETFTTSLPGLAMLAALAVGTVEARETAALAVLRAMRSGPWNVPGEIRDLLVAIPPTAPRLAEVEAEVSRLWPDTAYRNTLTDLRTRRETVWSGGGKTCRIEGGDLVWIEGGARPGDTSWAPRFRALLSASGVWAGVACGEPLYQAFAAPLTRGPAVFPPVPGAAASREDLPAVAPRRYPLASYIARRHPGLFDFLGLDEAHEYSGDGTAQERAAHRLTGLGMPVVLLTGSLMNGYAGHLFGHLWALDPDFRAAYARNARGTFENHYGYRRRYVDESGKKKDVSRGAVTDRVEKKGNKDLGVAPGIQPTGVLRFVLPRAVTLHKADLKLELPPLTVERVDVDPTPEQTLKGDALLRAIADRVKEDAFTPLSGALFGALSEGPSWYDRCTADQGNGGEGGAWEVRYPEARDVADHLVRRVAPFPAETVLPKEARLIADTTADLAAGRAVMVLAWHLELLPRYARLLAAIPGAKVAVLEAAKVAPSKRQAWIERQIEKGCNVLVTNPVCIQTGLNCLTHFSVQAWMENPGCNPIIYRQAVGRIDRIGQKRAPVVRFYVYRGTVQVGAHALLLRKAAVSQATDGLDPTAALQAAGVGEEGVMDALSVSKALLALLEERAGGRGSRAA